MENRKPREELKHLQEELDLYMPGLSKRPAIIVANKMALPESEENLKQLKEELCPEVIDVIPVCADKREIGELPAKLRAMVEERKKRNFDF